MSDQTGEMTKHDFFFAKTPFVNTSLGLVRGLKVPSPQFLLIHDSRGFDPSDTPRRKGLPPP
jgi:hypothetical protein